MMNQRQILELAIKMGMQADLRGEAAVKKHLARLKDKYDKMSAKGRAEFDLDHLTNPYPDSGIWHDNGRPIKKAMAGIDVTSAEILISQNLKVDGLINHHPLGKGLANLDSVMHLQANVLALAGVPINIAESLLQPRMAEVARGVHAVNHYQIVDAARLLGVNLMNIHTPADNLVARFLQNLVDKNKFEYVGELMDALKRIPEYQEAARRGAPVRQIAGHEDRRAGRIGITEITGGTEGAKNIYREMANAGVGTVVAMHLSEEHRKNAEEAHLNVVVAPHIASDSLGMNLFLDELEKKGIAIVPYGGLIRVKRLKR